jgi:hypothetical protein
MRKLKLLFVMVVAVFALSLSSCKKTKAKNCDNASTDYANAVTTFFNNPTVANCETFKSALKSLIDDCISKLPTAIQSEVQDYYDDINSESCADYVGSVGS